MMGHALRSEGRQPGCWKDGIWGEGEICDQRQQPQPTNVCTCPWPSPVQSFWVLALGYPNPNPPARAVSYVDSPRSGMVVAEAGEQNERNRWSVRRRKGNNPIVPYHSPIEGKQLEADLGNQAAILRTQGTHVTTSIMADLVTPWPEAVRVHWSRTSRSQSIVLNWRRHPLWILVVSALLG
jgi:hypothetical protein